MGFIPSTTASHASPAIRLRSSAAAQLPAIRSESSSNPPSTTTAEVQTWRCWVAMVLEVAARPACVRIKSPRLTWAYLRFHGDGRAQDGMERCMNEQYAMV
jgi:hypothetical protein